MVMFLSQDNECIFITWDKCQSIFSEDVSGAVWPFIFCLPRSFLPSQHSHVFHPIFCLWLLERKVVQLWSCSFMINKRVKLWFIAFTFVFLTVISHQLFYSILPFLLALLLPAWPLHSFSDSSPCRKQAVTALLQGSAYSSGFRCVPAAVQGQWEHFEGWQSCRELQVVFLPLGWSLRLLHPGFPWASQSSQGICMERLCLKSWDK